MEWEQNGAQWIAVLDGEIDHHAARIARERIDAAIAQHRIRELALDFGKVTFMDSSGIGLITGRFRMVHDKGGCVYAVHVNETIDRILLMSGIYRILKKMDSLDAIKKEMVKGGYYE